MGRRERHQKSQSVQSVAKSFAASFVVVCSFLACSQKTVVPQGLQQALSQPDAPALDVSSLGIQLTKIGDNDSPMLSADGKKIVFVSRKRPSHQQGQIYLYDLGNLKERRITYQDGECSDPILLKNGQEVIYASSTDELKERPLLFRKQASEETYPPTDLYLSDLSGIQITRLTQHPGFDGMPWLRPDKPDTLLYSSLNSKFLELWQLNLKSKNPGPFLVKKDRSVESFRLSPNGKQWTWIERNQPEKAEVVTAPITLKPALKKTIALPTGDYKEVNWLTNDKLILTAKITKKYFQFYSYDLTNQCLQSLFDSNTDLSSPQLNAERQGVVFVSTSNGSSQIYYKTLSAPGPCLKPDEKSEEERKPASGVNTEASSSKKN